jgi:hypothetical protein
MESFLKLSFKNYVKLSKIFGKGTKHLLIPRKIQLRDKLITLKQDILLNIK